MPTTNPRPALADQFRVLGTLGRGLRDFARGMGIDADPIIAAVGIRPEALEDLDADVSLDRFCRLLEVLATIAKDECFGLRFAAAYRIGGAGAFGYGLMSAPTLRDALLFCVKFGVVAVDLAHLDLEIDAREARLEWSYSPLVTQRDQFSDFAAALLARHFRLSAGEDWRPLELRLERAAPRSPAEFRKHLGQHVKFGCEVSCMILSADSLSRENPRADPLLFELMTRDCVERASRLLEAVDLVGKVRAEVLESLADRQAVASITARRLGMSERSLQRQLAERGVSFQNLVDETRHALSDRLLRDDRLSIAEISHRLGFAAPSAYTRSALRWYGKPPSEARKDME